MSTAIKVAVRIRPLIVPREDGMPIIVTTDGNTVAIDVETDQLVGPPKIEPKYFTYDNTFSPDVTQGNLYDIIGKPIRDSLLEGFNHCLFAYGQTGSGKTHSILGTEESPGVLRNLMEDIFKVASQQDDGNQLCLTVSFLEIYNEQLRDLLDPDIIPTPPTREQQLSMEELKSPNALVPPIPKRRPMTPPPSRHTAVDDITAELKRKKKLFIHQHPTKGVFVPNLTEAACGSLNECLSFLNLGLRQRATAQTNMNSQSSRSHSVFTIRLRQRSNNEHHSEEQHSMEALLLSLGTSSVHLIDLAGSERTKRSGAVGQRMKEGQSINTSLSVLGQVISKLSSNNKGTEGTHIPFRQSKLTYLLTDALTGNSYTWMLAAISPARHDQDETLSTLRFASSVKRIKTVPIRAPTPDTRPVIPADVVISNSYKSGSWKTRCSGVSPKGKLSSRQRRRLKLREIHKSSIGQNDKGQRDDEDEEEEVELSAQSYMEDSLDDWDAKLRASSKLLKELHMDNIHEIAGRKTKEPYILNISDDPSLSGCLIYFLNSDKGSCRTTTVGSSSDNDIVLVGLGIPDQLCILSVKYDDNDDDIGKVEVKRTAADSTGRLIVGGHLLDNVGQVNRLNSGDRIIFGRAFVFRLVIPGSSVMSTAVSSSSSQRMMSITNNMPIIEEEEIHQVMVESSMADTQTRKMASEVKAINRLLDNMGVSNVTEQRGRFIEMYSGTLTRVQEANDILSELRSNSGITLNLVVLTDVSQISDNERRKAATTDVQHSAAANPPPTPVPPPGMGIQVKRRGDIVDVWSVPKFLSRLEEMRSKHYISRMRSAVENTITAGISS